MKILGLSIEIPGFSIELLRFSSPPKIPIRGLTEPSQQTTTTTTKNNIHTHTHTYTHKHTHKQNKKRPAALIKLNQLKIKRGGTTKCS